MRVGGLTIGQAPRTDVLSVMGEILHDVHIIQAGALDDLGDRDIAALAPREGEYVLVTRLRDGHEVVVSRESIFERVQLSLDRLSQQTDLILFLCTGEFPGLRCSRLLIEPGKVLAHFVQGVADGRRLGVLIPHPNQTAEANARWTRVTTHVAVEVASPYQDADFLSAARALRHHGAEVVVMDCIGYTAAHKRLVATSSGVPTILAASAVARVLRELLP